MKRLLSLLSIILITTHLFSQKPVTWKSLARVKWHNTYVKNYSGYYDLPRLSESITDLNGKTVRIKGYFIPVDTNSNILALSARPSNKVFISNGKGSETVIEVIPRESDTNIVKLKPDKYIEIKGVLMINEDDPTHLMYTMKKVELIAVVTNMGGEKANW
jgi:hypothetical protein